MAGPLSWLRFARDRKAPASQLFAIVPADADLAVPARSLYVGGAGNVAVIGLDDSAAVTLTAVPAGTILPVSVKQVKSTGTTATGIVGLA
jgi:hypothetical protein